LNPVPLHAFNPGLITGDGNWTWLIPGRIPTLIDAGTGDPRHLAAVEDALGGARLAQVLVTHGHGDHASGAPDLARSFPEARFRKLPWPEVDDKWTVRWEPIADGERIEAGDTALTAVHTPGHAPDHVCFWHAESRTLFGGDLAIKGTTVWIPTRLQGDLASYLLSLERVLVLDPARLLPAHGRRPDHRCAPRRRCDAVRDRGPRLYRVERQAGAAGPGERDGASDQAGTGGTGTP
jgi:glyoxylase-like metal-dependent hydrolase (beta-lactamase superfamily II)